MTNRPVISAEALAKLLDGYTDEVKKLRSDIKQLSNQVGSMNRSLSMITISRNNWITIRYSHRDRTLFLNTFPIQFDEREAELLSIMFFKDGKPKSKKFQCSEVANDFKNKNISPQSPKRVYEIIKNINDKIIFETHVVIFSINTKEFFIFSEYLKKHHKKSGIFSVS